MTLALRPVCAGDLPFLMDVYASTRADKLAPLGWNTQQQTAFLSFQFRAQHQHYQTHYAKATFSIVLRNECPVGRFYVAREAEATHIVDIALLPAHRNAGIGTQLLAAVLRESVAIGTPTRLHVEKQNRARQLYERLGFRVTSDHGVHWAMEHSPVLAPLSTL